ncbi:MAG: hypothetical protein M1321_02685 [Candidatus Marsarchaeota archaeon]|nr:hypothetical protein [Candidatus Marsarchaeota archaeon]
MADNIVSGAQMGTSLVSGKALRAENLENLIICPGHGVYTGTKGSDPGSDANWAGIFSGEGVYYMQHAARAVELASKDLRALVVFSGGQTRYAAGPISEGQSYWYMSDHQGWFGHPEVRDRAVTEDYARDSAENLRFSFIRFFQITGQIPGAITACGWGFKRQRYELNFEGLKEMYIASLSRTVFTRSGTAFVAEKEAPGVFPVRFRYESVNNPEKIPSGPEGRVVSLYMNDKLGLNTPEIQAKSAARDPFRRGSAENYEHLAHVLHLALRDRIEVATAVAKAVAHKGRLSLAGR